MAVIQNIISVFTARTSGFSRGVKGARRQMGLFNRSVSTMRLSLGRFSRSMIALAGPAAIGLLIKKMVSLSSHAVEMQNKFNVVFRSMSTDVDEWATTFADAVGRWDVDVKEWAARLQDTFVPMGIARDTAKDMSQALVELGVHVGSFNDKLDQDVIDNFTSAIVGNHRAVRLYGTLLSEATIQQEGFRMGVNKVFGHMTDLEKVAIRMSILTKSQKDAWNDAIRTQGTYTNQLKRLRANLAALGKTMGDVLLPVANKFVTRFNVFLQSLRKISVDDIREKMEAVATAAKRLVAGLVGLFVLAKIGAIIFGVGKALWLLQKDGLSPLAVRLGLLVPLFGGILAGLVVFRTAWKNDWGGMKKPVDAVLRKMGELADFLSDQGKVSASGNYGAFGPTKESMEAASRNMDIVGQGLSASRRKAIEEFSRDLEKQQKILDDANQEISKLSLTRKFARPKEIAKLEDLRRAADKASVEVKYLEAEIRNVNSQLYTAANRADVMRERFGGISLKPLAGTIESLRKAGKLTEMQMRVLAGVASEVDGVNLGAVNQALRDLRDNGGLTAYAFAEVKHALVSVDGSSFKSLKAALAGLQVEGKITEDQLKELILAAEELGGSRLVGFQKALNDLWEGGNLTAEAFARISAETKKLSEQKLESDGLTKSQQVLEQVKKDFQAILDKFPQIKQAFSEVEFEKFKEMLLSASDISEMERSLDAFMAKTDEIEQKMLKQSKSEVLKERWRDTWQAIERSMATAFERALAEGQHFTDVMKQFAREILLEFARIQMFKPAAQHLTGLMQVGAEGLAKGIGNFINPAAPPLLAGQGPLLPGQAPAYLPGQGPLLEGQGRAYSGSFDETFGSPFDGMFHNGLTGTALKGDEFGAILQRGESVIPRGPTGKGLGAESIMVNVVNNGAPLGVESTNSYMQSDQRIIDVVVNDLRRAGVSRSAVKEVR